MGMSIEEHKEHLLDIMDSMPDDACGDWRDSLAYAVNIMYKYQKIEQILYDDTYYEDYGNNAEHFIVSAIDKIMRESKL